jgi:predicted dehydrogenase
MRSVRVAVIGAGLMGRRHAQAYRSLAGVDVLALADSDPAVQAAVARDFGVPCLSDWRAVLDMPDLDAVSICLPDSMHLAATEAACLRDLAVLLEKPVATDPDEAARIVELARGRTVLVGHMLRFDPRYQNARRALQAGRIGDVVHLKAWRNSAIGAAIRYRDSTSLVWHVGIHDIDLMQWMTGRPIVEVMAHGVSKRLAEFGHYDSVLALGRFADGVPFTLELSWVLPAHYGLGLDAGMAVMGTEGRIEVHGLDQGLRIADSATLEYPDTTRWVEYDDGTAGGILLAEIAHFIRAVREHAPLGVAVEDAAAAVLVAHAMEASLVSGAPVRLS